MSSLPKRYHYIATGKMVGWLWSGPKGSYPIKPLTADSRDELIAKAEAALADGSINSGDFDSVYALDLYIKATEYITVDGHEYNRDLNDPGAIIGELSDEDTDWLND